MTRVADQATFLDDLSSGFYCPRCAARSFNPNDRDARYCGTCHVFFEGKPAMVYRWLGAPEMVMVFDGAGDQVSALQGRFAEVRQAIISLAEPRTVFAVGIWREARAVVSRNVWARRQLAVEDLPPEITTAILTLAAKRQGFAGVAEAVAARSKQGQQRPASLEDLRHLLELNEQLEPVTPAKAERKDG